MKTKQQQQSLFQVKAVDDSARTFSGLASTWQLDQGGDVVEKGAFARTLDNWKNSNSRIIPLIDQHNYGSVLKVLGKMIDAKETELGLECTFEVKAGDVGDEVLNALRGGYVNGLSIGYEAVQWSMVKPEGAPEWEAVRHLTEVKLYEVSLVIWPMNEGALVDMQSVKSLLRVAAGRQLTDAERTELKTLQDQLGALLQKAPAADEPPANEGLAPDDPKRLELDEMLRDLEIRSLATR
jgi:HK97 family phage prohead protease